MSHVLLLETLERLALTYMQSALTARMLGGTAEVPDWFSIRADFAAAMAEAPKRVDTQKQAMLVAIGLRG